MTYFDAYIGDPDDKDFSCNNDNWNGNIPKRISPFIIGGFDEVFKRINRGEYSGKQTDWGGYTGIISKKEIISLLDFLYKDYHIRYAGLPHIIEQIDELKEFINKLDSTQSYYIVAAET